LVLYLLSREARPVQALSRISELTAAIEQREPKNHKLYYDVSQLCARLASRREQVLRLSMTLLDRALKQEPLNSLYMTEMAYQLSLLEKYEKAAAMYQEASKLDEGNFHALHG
jgi:tetratricopeptide (TPR) repeat protein